MKTGDLQEHWQRVYEKQQGHEKASWYQKTPQLVFDWIAQTTSDPGKAHLIDIGGGDSFFTDRALQLGYAHITLLDISRNALEKAAARLGANASEIDWICADVSRFRPERLYTLWHDRAAFHFLTEMEQRQGYKKALLAGVIPEGHVIIAAFSKNGPDKCSGLPVVQYSEEELIAFMEPEFEWQDTRFHDHLTPSGVSQNFIYTLFKRKAP